MGRCADRSSTVGLTNPRGEKGCVVRAGEYRSGRASLPSSGEFPMRIGLGCVLLLGSAPALAQQRLPIIDMHLEGHPLQQRCSLPPPQRGRDRKAPRPLNGRKAELASVLSLPPAASVGRDPLHARVRRSDAERWGSTGRGSPTAQRPRPAAGLHPRRTVRESPRRRCAKDRRALGSRVEVALVLHRSVRATLAIGTHG